MKEYYKTICTKLDSGQNLKLVGCKHGDWWNKSDFHLRKEEYIQSLNGADILVLEQPFLAEFYEEPFFKMISQIAYNKKHGITPQTIKKKIRDITKIWGIKEKEVKKGDPLAILAPANSSKSGHERKHLHLGIHHCLQD